MLFWSVGCGQWYHFIRGNVILLGMMWLIFTHYKRSYYFHSMPEFSYMQHYIARLIAKHRWSFGGIFRFYTDRCSPESIFSMDFLRTSLGSSKSGNNMEIWIDWFIKSFILCGKAMIGCIEQIFSKSSRKNVRETGVNSTHYTMHRKSLTSSNQSSQSSLSYSSNTSAAP